MYGGIESPGTTHTWCFSQRVSTLIIIKICPISFSDVSATGPKGLVKEDLLTHIERNNLKPIKVSAKPAKKQEEKSADAGRKEVARLNYELSFTKRPTRSLKRSQRSSQARIGSFASGKIVYQWLIQLMTFLCSPSTKAVRTTRLRGLH